jgi:hypothetical protein
MLKITFYPDDKTTFHGFYFKDGARLEFCGEEEITHQSAELILTMLAEQNKEGTIEACILVERKPGAYNLPKLDRVNSIFG